eukprot:3891166-Pyramimonas_sp.AAC.1
MAQGGLQDASKTAKMASKTAIWLQDASKTAQDAPKTSLNSLNIVQDGPRGPHEPPQTPPR